MRILVYGAGVQGSLYAARLHEQGHDVSLLARGQRLVDLRAHGVILQDVATGRRTTTLVPVVARHDPADMYDLVIVPVRREQVGTILPVLAAAGRIPTILFMHSHAGGSDDLVAAVGRGRVLLGFPGASGRREGPVIEYILIPQQPTTLGELDGRATPRATAIAAALRGAGFRVAISRDMDAWLKTHAVLVTAVSGALYLADGDNERLARTPDAVALFASGVREGFGALHALGIPRRRAACGRSSASCPIASQSRTGGGCSARREVKHISHGTRARPGRRGRRWRAKFKRSCGRAGAPHRRSTNSAPPSTRMRARTSRRCILHADDRAMPTGAPQGEMRRIRSA